MTSTVNRADTDNAIAGRSPFALVAVIAAIAFLALFIVFEKAGLPDIYTAVLPAIVVIMTIATLGLRARTTSLMDWFHCGYNAGSAPNGMAMAATVLSAPVLLSISGLFLADFRLGPAFLAGPLLGLALASVILAPHIRRAEAGSIGGYLLERIPSRKLALVVMLAILASCLPLLWTQISVGILLIQYLLPVDNRTAISIVLGLIAISILPGGLYGVIRINIFLYTMIAIGILSPLVWLSATTSGIPVPQIGAGYGALTEIRTLESQLSTIGIPSLGENMATGWLDPVNYASAAIFCLFLAVGIFALPAVLCGLQATKKVERSRISVVWALVFAALILSAAPAVAAFAKLGIYESLLGATTGEIRSSGAWLFDWSARNSLLWPEQPLVQICGQTVQDVQAVIDACGGNPDHAIGPADIVIHGELAILAFPQISSLPYILTVALCLGLFAAIISTANSLIFAISTSVAEDGRRFFSPDPPREMQRLFGARIAAVLALIAIGLLDAFITAPPVLPALWGLAVSASAIAPVLIASVVWPGIRSSGAIAGIAVPMLILLAFAVNEIFIPVPGLAAIRSGWYPELPDAVFATVIAFPAAIVSIVAMSLLQSKFSHEPVNASTHPGETAKPGHLDRQQQ
jgi:cation/acetate symporter